MREPENQDGRPERDESGGGLPGFPPEWGRIVIPDDPATLEAEAKALRRELRSPGGRAPHTPPRISLLVLVIAVLATLASFLAAMWPSHFRPSPGQSRTAGPRVVPTEPTDPTGRALPAFEVVDEDGSAVALHRLLPAVIILMEECGCPASVTAATAAVPAGVTVVALFSGVPRPGPLSAGSAAGKAAVRSLADPAGGVRSFLRAPSRPGEAATLLVARSGEIVRFLPAPTSTRDYQADLSRLVPA